MDDGVTARDMNREEQMKEAKNRQERYDKNKANDGNFFSSLSGAYNSIQNMATTGLGYLATQAGNFIVGNNQQPRGGIQNQMNSQNPFSQPSMYNQQPPAPMYGQYPGGYPPQSMGYPGQPGQPQFPQNPGQPGYGNYGGNPNNQHRGY